MKKTARSILFGLGLAAIAAAIWLYYAPESIVWRDLVIELIVAAYGAWMVLAFFAGWSIPVGAVSIEPDDPWAVRAIAALIGFGVVLTAAYLMVS
jgi:hypothetical protein